MIKIRKGFIKDKNNRWVNLSHVACLYVGGIDDTTKYRICYAYNVHENINNIKTMIFGEEHETREEAQAQLDMIMDLMEAEKG